METNLIVLGLDYRNSITVLMWKAFPSTAGFILTLSFSLPSLIFFAQRHLQPIISINFGVLNLHFYADS